MWNYRVFKNEHDELGIVECFYDKNDKPEMRSDFIAAGGDDLSELVEDLEHMISALKKPVLTDEDFKRETYSCWGCREQTTNSNSVCDKCVRDPQNNVCLKCGKNPSAVNMAYVCSECVFKMLDEKINDNVE